MSVDVNCVVEILFSRQIPRFHQQHHNKNKTSSCLEVQIIPTACFSYFWDKFKKGWSTVLRVILGSNYASTHSMVALQFLRIG